MAAVIRSLIVVAVMNPALAHAAIYMCKDASGRTITSDRPIPECADRTMRELNNAGALKREIVPPPTAEQKRLAEEQRKQRQAEELAAIEQRRSDQALLARYRNEEEIENARARETASLSNLIVQQKAALQVARNDWRAAAGNKSKQDLAAERVQEIAAGIHDSQSDLDTLNAKYDGVLKRYRELNSVASR
ncbi:DUF4124 domain-containing protein [Oxalicibacterium faecigallinarum]|uniref:DUF4124 domain-containing protein n=1 Tax=Oxalicibacterium faecigallinarum TaxID=573741 RepID=A0A8J3AQB6_9BURK|nr:DUF4124 domain-containing protein [Oxalicibacterium faecigallinarum]GGI18858.1 hypothetical protein GCM10008066_16180 [Oxalicibacterium faecigallinarum]